jgi:competence protein ComEC
MIPWSKYPFIRILLPLSAGILLCYFIRFVHIQFGVIIPLAALIILISFNSILADKLSYGFRWLTGLLFNLTIVIIGYCMMANTFLENLPDHFSNLPVKAEAYIAKTTSNPQSAKKYYKVPILITAINSNGKIIPCTGRVMCYISNRNSKILKLEYGDIIIFKKEVKRPEDPDCPWDFNYKSYLENYNIYHLTYLKPDEFRIISHGNGNYMKSFAIHTRDKLLSIIHQCGLSGEEFAVASAFLAGYDNEISNELYDAYSGAGVIHILSVSGLHVGIIFMMAQAFFSFLSL